MLQVDIVVNLISEFFTSKQFKNYKVIIEDLEDMCKDGSQLKVAELTNLRSRFAEKVMKEIKMDYDTALEEEECRQIVRELITDYDLPILSKYISFE